MSFTVQDVCYTASKQSKLHLERRIRIGQKWGRNEDIHIGDIFRCWEADDARPEYYQVTALRGKTQVVLRAIRHETFIDEGIPKESPLYWLREKRRRPLPGQFMSKDEMWSVRAIRKRGREIIETGEIVTAWVLPWRTAEGRPQFQEVGEFGRRFGISYR